MFLGILMSIKITIYFLQMEGLGSFLYFYNSFLVLVYGSPQVSLRALVGCAREIHSLHFASLL